MNKGHVHLSIAGNDKKRLRPHRSQEPITASVRRHESFALEYAVNGGNAAAAYRATHPRCRSNNAASVEGHRLLRNPNVWRLIAREQEARANRLRMDGDEALEHISRIGRADIRQLFDRRGELLPVHQWPADVSFCVKSIKWTPAGPAVVMHDKLRALEAMATAGGKLRQRHDHTPGFDPVAYLGAEPPKGDDEPPTAAEAPMNSRR